MGKFNLLYASCCKVLVINGGCGFLDSFFLSILLTSCSEPSPIPYKDLKFVEETSSNYVGSYYLGRISKGQKWPEYGEWTKLEFAFKSTVVCFGGFDSNQSAVFRASEGYYWTEVEHQGRLCLELQKKQ